MKSRAAGIPAARVAGCAVLFALATRMLPAAEPAADPAGAEPAPASITDVAEAGDGEDTPRRRLVHWNEYAGPYMTLRVGGGLLYDYVGYSQDEDSKDQMSLDATGKLRDFRFILKGEFPKIPGLTYTIGYMYDAGPEQWKFRQTGLQYEIPALHGRVFVGRTKEGISTNKLMVGYQGWTMERATVNDAFLPILADGIKWMGNSPDGRLVYSVGVFDDNFSDKESFNKYDNQVIARAVWLPFNVSDPERVLHLAAAYRWGSANDGQFHFRSKPESYPAQSYAIDSGSFAADHSNMVGLETYYRPGPLMFGMEYFLNQVQAPTVGDPFFHGGEIFASYISTGEVRPYNRRGAFFDRISPKRTVFEGGPGAWEWVLRYSYTDLDDKDIQGGKFWRITPMVNWHMSDNVRLEFVYGYGVLDRFSTKGATQFFQTRLQLQL